MTLSRLSLLCLLLLAALFGGCDDSKVDASVISQGAKMSPKELEKLDNLDKASYAELADLFLDNKNIDPKGKYLLLVFGSNGCIYCEKLKQEIKENPEIKAFIQENFSPYYINGSYSKPHQLITAQKSVEMMTEELVRLYGVRPTPTLIFATPEGKTILTYPGYMPKDRLQATLGFIIQKSWEGANDEKEILHRLNTLYKEKNI